MSDTIRIIRAPKPQPRTKVKRKHKSERKKLVAELDRVFSLFIRKRDGYCVTCGRRDKATCGHLLTRSAYSTRWDEINSAQQCAPCNGRHEWDASNFTVWFLRVYGQPAYEALTLRHHTPRKFTNEELHELIEKYDSPQTGAKE
jgi:hypothetical protein